MARKIYMVVAVYDNRGNETTLYSILISSFVSTTKAPFQPRYYCVRLLEKQSRRPIFNAPPA